MTSKSEAWSHAEVIQIEVPMVEPLATAHGKTDFRPLVLVRIERDGVEGWGECVALPDSSYDGESSDEGFDRLSEFLAAPSHLALNNSAAYAYDMAIRDLELRAAGRSLAQSFELGSVVPVAVVGLGSIQTVLDRIDRQRQAGYRHFKLKVTPTFTDVIGEAVATFSDCLFRVDANESFNWSNVEHQGALRQLATFGLDSIEQPFARGFENDNQKVELLGLKTTLDESVTDVTVAERLIKSGFGTLVVKPYRFRSIDQTISFATDNVGSSLSIGGMIDGPLSRSVNIVLAAMKAFGEEPAEIAVDGRWFARSYSSDVVTIKDGVIPLPTSPGVGTVVDRNAIDDMTKRSNAY